MSRAATTAAKWIVGSPVIRVARDRENQLFVRRKSEGGPLRPPVDPSFAQGAFEAMDSFELNKILGAILGSLPGVLEHQYRRRRDLRATQARQARLRHRGPGQARRRRVPRSRPSPSSRSRRCWPRPTSAAARMPPRNAPPAIPSTRADGRWSAPTCGASSAGRRPPRRASTIRRRSRPRAATGRSRTSTTSSPTRRAMCRAPT